VVPKRTASPFAVANVAISDLIGIVVAIGSSLKQGFVKRAVIVTVLVALREDAARHKPRAANRPVPPTDAWSRGDRQYAAHWDRIRPQPPRPLSPPSFDDTDFGAAKAIKEQAQRRKACPRGISLSSDEGYPQRRFREPRGTSPVWTKTRRVANTGSKSTPKK